MIGRKIITRHVAPPIPVPFWDWLAFFEDEGEEAARYGWAASEEGAVKDLLSRYGDINA